SFRDKCFVRIARQALPRAPGSIRLARAMGGRAGLLGGLGAVVVTVAFWSAPAPADVLAPRLVHDARKGLGLVEADYSWRGWLRPQPRARSWARIWESVHALDAAAGLAAATRRPADAVRVSALARAAEGYWNPELARVGGYSTYYRGSGVRSEN